MMQLRYKSITKTNKEETVELRIYQKSETPFSVQEIAITNLEFEWNDVDKLEPVMSSSATLTVISDTDRRFVDLYTIEAGSVRMDVYLENQLYWSGSLDPELYEEPFSYKDGYDVTLTFTDFAILDRIKYDLTGFVSFAQIIDVCLEKSGIQYEGIRKYISTTLPGVTATTIYDDTSYLSDNFYDEDDEPMTLREVLDELLRVYSLRLLQKRGSIWVYDLNALKKSFKSKQLVWDSDDAVLGVDKVYNNIRISFSPYQNTELIKVDVDKDKIPSDVIYVVYADNEYKLYGFDMPYSFTGDPVLKLGSGLKYFKINSVYSGSDCAGVIHTLHTYFNGSFTPAVLNPTEEIGGSAFKVNKRAFVSQAHIDNAINMQIRIKLDLLFDVRYNPFESAKEANEEGAYGRLEERVKIIYVPIKLTLRDDAGKAICHWDNSGMKSSEEFTQTPERCKWVDGEASWGSAFLCYYQYDRDKNKGVGGWQTNKPCIGWYLDPLPLSMEKLGNGEFIRLPQRTGWLDLEVGTGTPYRDAYPLHRQIMHEVRWVMYKDPEVKLVTKLNKEVQINDCRHEAWINKSAKEELSMDTIIGTMKKASPIAKGQVFAKNDLRVLTEFERAGRREILEKLLIGTIHSNYANRNNTLSGTCEILHDFGIYTDEHEPGDYVLLSERQNIHDCTSEIKMVTFKEDVYEVVEYK